MTSSLVVGSALVESASLLTLDPALLGNVLVLQHAASLLHELAHGGVVLAVLAGGVVVVVRRVVAVAVRALLALFILANHQRCF